MDDDGIRVLLTQLGRPHPSGGTVVERAAVLAEGADFDAVMAWILAHGGKAEERSVKAPSTGLHGARGQAGAGNEQRAPLRFVLPAGALR